ncbi:unnamed protein product [Wuchereria bancrofti]|uniref:Uncharacterized protein n=1 Tax=Wuchereria bancrofti TaxID=6293 RepID=A0A3P7EI01_WUCBA|nr:unnamed protein product [Wuchereria bancrofti]
MNFLCSFSRDFEKLRVELTVQPLVSHLDHSPLWRSATDLRDSCMAVMGLQLCYFKGICWNRVYRHADAFSCLSVRIFTDMSDAFSCLCVRILTLHYYGFDYKLLLQYSQETGFFISGNILRDILTLSIVPAFSLSCRLLHLTKTEQYFIISSEKVSVPKKPLSKTSSAVERVVVKL